MHKFKPILVIHGGAGNGFKKLSREDRDRARDEIKTVLQKTYAILAKGGSALDAATAAVVALENCPLFNAGRGSVISANGEVEMDASIMDGATGKTGGVSTVKIIKNPILAAKAVMEHSRHTVFCAEGAEDFAKAQGLKIVENKYFITRERKSAWKQFRKEKEYNAAKALGTVGAVAMDQNGNIAAATSTGGLTDKAPGRVSDSALPGAGTWAKNGVCGISCTGTGDVFIRNVTAFDAAAMVEYQNMDLKDAFASALEKVKAAGGYGGMIGIDANGNAVMDFNTEGMYRGVIDTANKPKAWIT